MENKGRQIAREIMEDILDRKGIGNEMEIVDDDVREEILSAWEGIVNSIIEKT